MNERWNLEIKHLNRNEIESALLESAKQLNCQHYRMCNECEMRCCDEPMCLSPTVFRKCSSLDTVHSTRQRTNIVDIIRSTRIRFYVWLCERERSLKTGEKSSLTHKHMSDVNVEISIEWFEIISRWNVNDIHILSSCFSFSDQLGKKRNEHLYLFFCGHHRGSLIPNRSIDSFIIIYQCQDRVSPSACLITPTNDSYERIRLNRFK